MAGRVRAGVWEARRGKGIDAVNHTPTGLYHPERMSVLLSTHQPKEQPTALRRFLGGPLLGIAAFVSHMGGNLNRLMKFSVQVTPFVGRELQPALGKGRQHKRSEESDPKANSFNCLAAFEKSIAGGASSTQTESDFWGAEWAYRGHKKWNHLSLSHPSSTPLCTTVEPYGGRRSRCL